jgi:aquaporin Z
MKKYAIEFIGTFFLVLVIALTGNPLAIGAILIAMVYMGGYISGAHYNPAVTLAVFLRGKITLREAGMYVTAQLTAGLVAAITYFALKGAMFTPKPSTEDYMVFVFSEILFTFALATVVLHVATADKIKGNSYFGLAIGLTVMTGAFAMGPISGAVFNPAVAVGPILFDLTNIGINGGNLITYIIAPLIGGAFAATVYNMTSMDPQPQINFKKEEAEETISKITSFML